MTKLVTSEEEAKAKSRLAAIRMCTLSLRLRTSWSQLFGDADTASIGLAVAAVQSERLLRAQVDPALETLSAALPNDALRGCNISSIAAASGLNRETVRRKVNRLVQDGVLVRDEGDIRFAPGFTQQQAVIDMIMTQVDQVRATAEQLLRDGILQIKS